MSNLRGIITVAMGLLSVLPAWAQVAPKQRRVADPVLAEDLVPEEGVLRVPAFHGQALLELRAWFLEEHAFHRRCQMLMPGGGLGSPEVFAVYLVRDREKATAHLKRLLERKQGEDRPQVSSKSAGIRSDTADLLEQVWELMLERVRLPPREISLWNDAPTYYFDTCCTERSDLVSGSFVRAGRARRTRPERLAEIGDTLVTYVEAKPANRAAIETDLKKKTRDLLAELITAGGKPPDLKARRSR